MNTALRDALARGAERLRAAGIESARLDARLLLARALGVAPDAVFSCAHSDPERLALFELLVSRRARREPLAYITGHKEFWNLDFAVGPGVLIPRPETETLVEEALRVFPDQAAPLRVLDVGTGSGCLLIAFLCARTGAVGIGIDTSETALGFARRNAANHAVDGRCRFFETIGEPAVDERFDVVLANPPYLSEEEFSSSQPEIRDHEPAMAFLAGCDGLAGVRALAPLLERNLGGRGRAFVEIGAGQEEPVREILRNSGLDVHKTAPDLSGVARCLVIGRLEPGGHECC